MFIVLPVLYIITQFIPYYHSGGSHLPSMWSLFWYPTLNEETINFLGRFYFGFRINEFVTALLITQLAGLFLIILTLIKKNSGLVAAFVGCWGAFGLYAFFTTRGLTFSPVMVYGGIAGILMLVIFLAAVVASGIYLFKMYMDYKALLDRYNAEQAEKTSQAQ